MSHCPVFIEIRNIPIIFHNQDSNIMFISKVSFAKLYIIGVYMYNRGLKKYKYRRNPTISDFSLGVPASKYTFSSTAAARAYLLRHDDICIKYDPKDLDFVLPEGCTHNTLAMIDNARKVTIKADRRNYRRATKKAAKMLIIDRVKGEDRQDALRGLRSAIKKALEIEGNRILRAIHDLIDRDLNNEQINNLRIKLRQKAIAKLRLYFTNVKLGRKKIGARPKKDIPSEVLKKYDPDKGNLDLDFPSDIKSVILDMFESIEDELIQYPSDDTVSHTYDVEDDSGEYDSLPDKQRYLDFARADQIKAEREGRRDVKEVRETSVASYNEHHRWERVLGPEGEILTFKVGRVRGKLTCTLAEDPDIRVGDVILDMTGYKGAVAFILSRESQSGRPGPEEIESPRGLTPEMRNRYENSYLYLVRSLAMGQLKQVGKRTVALGHTKFISLIKNGLPRKPKYRGKSNLRKRRKR